MRWRLITNSSLLRRSWGEGQEVVFHSGSGDTHLLNDVASELLYCLEEANLTCDELAERCAVRFDAEPDDGFKKHVAEIVGQFDELGLIETAP